MDPFESYKLYNALKLHFVLDLLSFCVREVYEN